MASVMLIDSASHAVCESGPSERIGIATLSSCTSALTSGSTSDAAGAPTLTRTSAVSLHHPLEVTTRYVVDAVGLAIGLAMCGLLSPAVGYHSYVVPPDACSCTLPPAQIESALSATD